MSDQKQEQDSFFTETRVSSAKPLSKKAQNTILLLTGTAYAGLAAALTYFPDIPRDSPYFLFGSFVYGILGGVGLYALKDIFKRQEKKSALVSEVLANSKSARLITDGKDQTIYFNKGFVKMLPDFQPPTLNSFAEIFTNSRKMRSVLNHLKQKALNKENATTETNAIIDQEVRSIVITAKLLPSYKNHIDWQLEDITPLRNTELRLKREEEKLADFTDNAPVGFYSVDKDGEFLYSNSVLEKWLAVEPGELAQGGKLHDFLFDTPENVEPYEVFENDDDYQTGELSMVAKDGRIFKAAVTHLIVRDDDGNIRTRSVVYDLSSEQEIEAALRETQDSFVRLFEEAPVGICLIARDGAIDAANHSFGAMFHSKTQDITHQRFTDFIAEADRKNVSNWIEQLFTSKHKSATMEAHLNTDDETIVQIFGRKFRGGDSMVLHFIDLTEQKTLEQKFTQSQKMQAIGQLAGGVAHDFNNLLTAMIGFCDLLLLRHKPGDPSFSDLQQIKQNANRAANLVRQLLAFSRQQTLQPKVLDLSEVLSEISHLIRRLIGAQIKLSIEHHSKDPERIKVDQGQLEQVLINLAVNARDAMDGNGSLDIRTSTFENDEEIDLENTNDKLPPGKWVKIEVQDSGSGIPPEIITRIFEPFFTTKELGSGTGLGLSTVHGIIHQTGGFLSVATTVGEGTTFSIFIPFYIPDENEKIPEKKEVQKSDADLSGTARILLVEDEDAVRSFSARALSNKGYEVIEAVNGRDALDQLGDDKPDLELIITDVVMPEMDGPTMIEELRKHYTNTKIIFMSGYTEDRLKEQFGDQVHFLPKPFTLKQLATKVKDVLDG